MWEFQIYRLAESGFSRKTSEIWQFGSKFLIWKKYPFNFQKENYRKQFKQLRYKIIEAFIKGFILNEIENDAILSFEIFPWDQL